MKYASALVALLLVWGCASASDAQKALADKVQLQLAQSTTTQNLNYLAGPVNIQYQLGINNTTDQTITLRRLQLRTISPGAYSLRTPTSYITATIPAHQSTAVNLSAWGYTTGSTLRSEEPVSIQGTAYFDTAQGSFVKIFTQLIPQSAL